MRTTDTIAAISTALSPSGIGIVRLSGEDAIRIADKVYRGKQHLFEVPTHTIHYGHIVQNQEIIDQVLVTVMRGPGTFTGEDTVEINCHGGILVLQKTLSLVLDAGAVPAEPGEFTKRAFLNGKMDLSQAEAVADVIDAGSRNALLVGMRQLSGSLSREIKSLRATLLTEIAWIEAALDDPEHYSLDEYRPELITKMDAINGRLDRLLRDADKGMVLRSGINTVILGKPNAGKSSLYNALAGKDRAIVTEIAGTTRDTLTEQVRFAGTTLNLTDTAGLRDSRDIVEQIGVNRAREAAEEADLLLCVLDGSRPLEEEDRKVLQLLNGRKAVIFCNKVDLGEMRFSEKDLAINLSIPVVYGSAKTGGGLDLLEKTIRDLFSLGEIAPNDEIYVTQIRHADAIRNARKSMELAMEGAVNGLSEDLISVDLTDALRYLGEVTGETVGDDIISEIFSKFCMGK